MESRAKLRVFLADDHPVVREGIRALLHDDAGLDVVGEAQDGPSALRQAIALRPDIAVLDLSMPGMTGAEVAGKLIAACPHCRVLVLTVDEDGAHLRALLDMGVAGYVLKRSAAEDLRRGIHAIASGGIYLDPAIAARALGRDTQPPPAAATDGADLSARELEVLRLAAGGQSNKAIATMLNIGVKTVDTYKARAMAKLGFKSRVEVVRFAVSRGWMNDG